MPTGFQAAILINSLKILLLIKLECRVLITSLSKLTLVGVLDAH